MLLKTLCTLKKNATPFVSSNSEPLLAKTPRGGVPQQAIVRNILNEKLDYASTNSPHDLGTSASFHPSPLPATGGQAGEGKG
jgi:hypothetical protein